MSDIRLFNYKTGDNFSKTRFTNTELKNIILKYSYDLLGITLITSNYKADSGVIEMLGYDESFQLVILEFRENRYGQTINRGIYHIDYIKSNISEFKILITKKLGKKISNQVLYNPRLIVVGDDFSRYDEYAVKQLRANIDLIKAQSYTQGMMVLEKAFQGNKQFHDDFQYSFKSDDEKELFTLIQQFILSLGDEIVETGFNGFLSYRKIKTFLYIIFQDNIIINLKSRGKYRSYEITSESDFEKLKSNIESSYIQN